ncbi:MAG: YceI family protein [Nocardioides sp.]
MSNQMSIFSRTKTAPTGTDADFEQATQSLEDITGDYALDVAHTRLGFSARHAMVTTVRGQFKEFAGTAHVDTQNPANSKVELTIDATSVDTGNDQRNGHLASADFFDVEAHPQITFVSTEVERADDTTWVVTGDLTIKGTSNPVTIEFEQTGSARDPFGNLRVGFEGSTAINRKDWGLTYNAALETGGVLVSDRIKLDFDISAIQNAAVEA